MKIEFDIEKRMDKIFKEVTEIFVSRAANDGDYYDERRIIESIQRMVAEKFVEENYEEIAQKISKDDIAKYVTQRAILLTGRKITDGE